MKEKASIKEKTIEQKERSSLYFSKKRVLEILKGIVTFLIFYFGSYLQIIPIAIFNIDVNNYTATDLALVNTFCDLLLVIILVILYFKELKKEFIKFKENYKSFLDTGLKYWMVGLVIMCVSNILIGMLTSLNTSSNEQAVQTLISSTPYMMILTAGILAPIAEEITFRKGINKIFKSKWLYCFASGFIFGLLHVIGSGNILEYLYIIPYGSLGFFFALTYYETKNIYPSICMHALHNTALVILSIISL